MKVTLSPSTGAKILVWREEDVLHARRADLVDNAQTCLAVDLFEVLAELAGLDLEQPPQAAEAIALAEHAQRRLGFAVGPQVTGGDRPSPGPPDGSS